MKGGIPAVLISENLKALSPYMHTDQDILGTSLNDTGLFEASARLGAAAVLTLAGPLLQAGGGKFLRQDANVDGAVDLSDAIFTLQSMFLGGPPTPCPDAADANDDGELDISDPVAILFRLFLGSFPVPEPAGACGPDPTGDGLDCPSDPACSV